MSYVRNISRLGQRLFHDLRTYFSITRIRYVFLISILFIISSFVFIYKDESYQYTSDSLQTISDRINLISSKIDSFNINESFKQDNEIPDQPASMIESTTTSSTPTTIIPDSATTANGLHHPSETEYPRENGVILIFARNAELYKLVETIWSFEQRFNQYYHYHYLIVTDINHTRNFRRTILSITSSNVEFHTVPRLGIPNGLSNNMIKEGKKNFRKQGIKFKRTSKQRNELRFWSKGIFEIEALKKYDYYLRIDLGAFFYNDIQFDFFKFMKEHERTYGFGFAQRGQEGLYPSLWENTLEYIKQNSGDINKNNMIDFISDDKGETFNRCQFRSNFEIGDLNFFRSEKFLKLAEYFDEKKGIYYEGWDDSTIRTLAVTLLEDKHKIQFFNNIGYNDHAYYNLKSCPSEESIRLSTNCICDPLDDITWTGDSCIERYFNVNSYKIPEYVEDYKKFRAEAEERKRIEAEKNKVEEEQARKAKEMESAEQAKVDQETSGEDKDKDKDKE
ncbi:Glycolipid 2-alpha-mannosyltransferase [Wickerhamomyces ciferrii]|uniref:Glycolipid 2-alpha-mannosyltransferase n=1 Tax=Wickerhamomyces ciferrii (strain ATCC 14091 / BCRC 22168 / CBS 111 / JCM 3599 / NBRC 0793 / NRRL Y-1031 F-60-10) TaxID=1206466 RepID=K0KJH0_WICCF|nr:Glycolipid 2-alpha-mannosyltransferase [Wickerhamomyces ciferrii]CCH43121.1 Glycolipid 2-alpha-mannosyltransferase [Wickerhamomyces ciferrii]